MSALTDLKAADDALKAEVASFLADVAARLTAYDPDVGAVAAYIRAQVAALQAAHPAAPASDTTAETPAEDAGESPADEAAETPAG